MADRESIKTKVWDENVGLLNSAKKDIDAQAEAERLKQRQEAEAGINKVNGMAKEQSDSLYKDYDMAEQISAVQKIINERYIKRKMAEWGLSNSGVKNRRLEKAEHLSLKSSAENRESFNKGKTEINTWKQGQIAKIEKVRDGNIGVIDKNAADLKKQADGDFNKWVDTETNRQYSYAVEQEQKLLRQKNERIKAVSASIAELKGNLNGYLTEWAKWTCIQSHIEKYGVSDALINMLGSSGYGKDEALQKMTSFFNNKKVSDQYKIQRFVDYYKIYGMPSEEYMKAITSGNMPGHNVTMSELKSALASIDETGYAKNRAIATNSEYDPFIYSGKKGAELLGQYEVSWRQKDARKKEAEKLWEYATTPQLPKSATGRTPPYISSPTKKETNGLSFNPIAVTGAPYSKESGVKLVSPEAYDVIMQEREKLYSLFEKSPKEALSFAKTVNAELDKSAENVKMKAEESEKSSYEQVIDELAELLRERKDNKALSFWDKLESRVSTNDTSYNSGKNPVSSSEQVGSSEKRGEEGDNSLKSVVGQINKWFSDTFGVASTIGSDYKAFSWNNFFGDIETGLSLNKEYKGKYKPIEFISEISAENNIFDNKGGVKVNFSKNNGFKITFGIGKLSFESANKDSFFEFIVEPNKVGITVSNEVDWKNYSVGNYTSYYIRPQSMALAAAAVAGVVAAVYYTKGAIIPVFAAL